MDKQLIGNRIRHLREEKGLTQAMLAELAEISERTVSDIKNGKIVSKYNNIIKISCILKVPNNYLLSDRCAFDKPGTISNILEIMSELTHDDIQHFILYIDFYKNEKKFFKNKI